MIFSILIRNYKTYQSINYIPLSNTLNFTAIIGENGVGKSSILEALNSYFNSTEWNLNHSLSKGFQEREPFICPIFSINKENCFLSTKQKQIAEKLSLTLWSIEKENFNSSNRAIGAAFCKHRNLYKSTNFNSETHYLLPIGIIKRTSTSQPEPYISIFDTIEDDILGQPTETIATNEEISEILSEIQKFYKYVYIPSDVDFHLYTKIEGKTIQALLGKKIDEIVKSFISPKTITEINRNLTTFLNEISETLGDYEYKKPAKKQNLFNHSHFTEKVIEAFFDSKVLSKITDKSSTPVYNLSSGEKRKALIDVAKAFLLETGKDLSQKVILAIDEPELSLHISSSFEQFEKLKEISEANVQTLITTHWYGFMPIVTNGISVYIPRSKTDISIIDLRCFRDDIKRLKESSLGSLPAEIGLKGINDLVQSIIASITGADYKWVICEGSSDKIYLEHYLKGEKKTYILPVGASKNVKKVYKYITMALDQEKDDISGKVFFLLDTDKRYEQFEAPDSIKDIRIRRLLNCTTSGTTKLELTNNNNFFPPTTIEDVLDPQVFLDTLNSFSEDPELSYFFEKFKDPLSVRDKTLPGTLSFDLREGEKLNLEQLFNEPHFKIKFALKYTSLCPTENKLSWIDEIKHFLTQNKQKSRVKPK